MRALPGDRLLVRERREGEGDREALIIEVRSEHGRVLPDSADVLIAGDSSR
jgi:hypothetical protein